MAKTYSQCEDGETVEIPDWEMYLCCCDCGLTHYMKFKPEGRKQGKLYMQIWRDNRATGQHRRWRKK